MHRKLILCVSLVCFGAINLAAQQQKAVVSIQSSDPRFDELRSKGFDALYNLEYDGARRYFREMVRLFPAHPAGPQFLAATLWTETLNESRRLQASLYNTESFYAKNEDKVDPKIITEFNALTNQARTLAEARLKANSKDVEALYFLGAVEGLKAAFAGAVQRSFLTALREGQHSVGHHREVLKLDPQFRDAELTIGLYDYVIGQLPLPVKILASLTGNRGSKRRGLETLQLVAREAKWARDDANVVLIALFKREGRFNDALAVTRELGTKYPRNFLFKLEAADALVSQAAVDRTANPTLAASEKAEAIKILDTLLRDRTMRTAAGKSLDLIHFRYGEALFTSGQAEQAAKEFLSSAAVPNAQAGLATMALLRAAQALDIAGKRADALSNYKAVLSRPDVYDAHDEARDGLQRPYKLHSENRAAGTEANLKKAS
jgi:tetratricopeptide (TPR) repeat protein